MKKVSFLLLTAFTFIIGKGNAQTTWEIISQPRTWNDFIASSFINDEEGWLIDNNAILWHTADGCETLDTIFTGKYFKKLQFASSTIGYALDANKVYKTTDGGVTWSTLTLPGSFDPVLYFLNKDTGFVSSTLVYYRTMDGGNTWTTLTMPSTTLWRDYWFTNDSTGFAVTEDYSNDLEIYRTTNCGVTWDAVGGDDESHLYSIWFSGEDTGWAAGYYDFGIQEYEIFKSVDGGLTWDVNYTEDTYDETLSDIRFKSNNREGYTIGGYDDFLTVNGGDEWFYSDDYDTLGLPFNVWDEYQTALDGYDDLYLVGKHGTLLKWGKDTAQWKEASGRLVSDVMDLSFTSATNGWMATGGAGILKTSNAGNTWNKVPGPKFFTSVVDAVNDSMILAAGSNNWWPDQTIYRSVDGGQTWDSVYFFADMDFPSHIEMLDQNNGYILLKGQNGAAARLYKTVDGGINWTLHLVGIGDDASDIWSMFFLDVNTGWIILEHQSHNKVYRTTDGGITWTLAYQYTGSAYEFTNIFYTDSLHGYLATTGSNYYESFDGGTTWAAKSIPGASNYIKCFFTDSLHGWFLTKYDLYETVDAGATWINIYQSEVELYDFEYAQGSIFIRGFYGFLVKGSLGCLAPSADFSYTATELDATFTDQSANATSWSWDFGDGNNSTEQNPLHTYSSKGTYNVCLTITDTCGSNTSCQSITVCEALNTDYIFNQNNLSVHFSNLVTSADSAYWDFGDGNTSTATNPTHNYASPNTYNACLHEFDVCGNADTMCKQITVCSPLSASFSFFVNAFNVQFSDASVNATQWNWNFGDGDFSADQNPMHTFSATGSYNVCLIAGNACTADTLCEEVFITGDTVCNAYFIIQSDQNQQGLYWGYNLSEGQNLTYTWNWGDGTTSTGEFPAHTYADSGFYDICLIVFDSITSCTDSFCANYLILKPEGMMGIHEIIFADYPLSNPSTADKQIHLDVFPNPFSSMATISFSLNEDSRVSIELFSVNGKKLKELANANFSKGEQQINFSRQLLTSGIYFLQLKTASDLVTRKIVVE